MTEEILIPPTPEPELTQPLEDSLSTLQRLQIEHFPDQYDKERANFEKRAEELRNRITPFI